MGAWRLGISLVIVSLTLFFAGVAVVDIIYEYQRRPPIGVRVQRWSRRYRFWSLALILLYGALLAHFFINQGWGQSTP